MPRGSRTHFSVLTFVLAAGLPLSSTALAQTPAIYGQVTNNRGEPIPGARIHITQASGKGKELQIKADKQGEWIYWDLADVSYRIVARAPGYRPTSKSNVRPTPEGTRVSIVAIAGDPNGPVVESTAEGPKVVIVDAEKARELQQASGELKEALSAGAALMKQGKFQEAAGQFSLVLERSADLPPRIRAGILANLADALWKAGRKSEALANYDKAIAAEPDEPTLWINKGTVQNDLGRTAEAQESFRKAIELNPAQKGEGLYNIGVLFLNAGQMKEANTLFRQSIEADPAFAESYFQLGRCLLGEQATISEAIKNLEAYLRIGKDPQNLQTAREIIAAMKK